MSQHALSIVYRVHIDITLANVRANIRNADITTNHNPEEWESNYYHYFWNDNSVFEWTNRLTQLTHPHPNSRANTTIQCILPNDKPRNSSFVRANIISCLRIQRLCVRWRESERGKERANEKWKKKIVIFVYSRTCLWVCLFPSASCFYWKGQSPKCPPNNCNLFSERIITIRRQVFSPHSLLIYRNPKP